MTSYAWDAKGKFSAVCAALSAVLCLIILVDGGALRTVWLLFGLAALVVVPLMHQLGLGEEPFNMYRPFNRFVVIWAIIVFLSWPVIIVMTIFQIRANKKGK